MIDIRILGQVDVRTADDRDVTALRSQPKRLALLAFLGRQVGRGPVRRDTLLALFWPEADTQHAGRALNQALYVIRQQLGRDVFAEAGREYVFANPDRLQCDAALFDDLIKRGESAAALSLYRSDFMEGFHLDGCPEFDQWIDRERASLSRRAIEGAMQLATREHSAGNTVGYVQWLREATRLARYDQSIQLALVRALSDLGDRSGALRELEAFQRRLTVELELPASADIEREAHRLRSEAAAGTDPATAEVPTPVIAGVHASVREKARPRRFAVTAAVALFGAIVFLALRAASLDGKSKPPSVLVVPFENLTPVPEDARLGRIVAERIADDLSRSGLVSVVQPAAVWGGSRRSEWRTSAGYVVSGSVSREAGQVILRGAISNSTGRLLRSISATSSVDDQLAGIEPLRRQLVGALASVVDPRLSSWASSASPPRSLEAYQLQVDGLDLLIRSRWDSAALLFSRAADIDSGFTSPLLWALYARQNAGDRPGTDSLIRRLDTQRHWLPSWDRAMFDFLRSREAGDQESAYRSIRIVGDLMPASEWLFLAGAQALLVNRPTEAVAYLRRIQNKPDNPLAAQRVHRWLTDALHRLGEYSSELETTRETRRVTGQIAPIAELRALIALGRVGEALDLLDRELAIRQRDWNSGNLLWQFNAELRAHGRASSDSVLHAHLAWYEGASVHESADRGYRERLAHLLMMTDRREEAAVILEDLNATITSPRANRHVRPFVYLGPLGTIAAQRGDTSGARRFSAAIEADRRRFDYGEGTLWRAAIAAQLRDPGEGTRLFRQAVAEGLYLMNEIWIRPELAPLRSYSRFQELLRVQ